MQYIWHAGDRVYAGAMFTDTTFVLDVSKLPEVRLTGHPVSMAVNQAANDAPELIAPAALAPDLFD